MLWLFLTIAVFFTSVLSGVLGMAGGMILMAILVTILSVANAMILHGAVQATANGSRAWFLRRHIKWRLLPNYMLGAIAAVVVFSLIALVPDPGLVLFLVGVFPWLARYSRSLKGLDVTRPLTTIVCGFVVTAAQLLAGASGPLLDVFYLNSPLSRHEIVANKALTQTIGHLLKILYYAFIVSVATTLPWWLFICAMTAAVSGTRFGTALLHRWDDAAFGRVSSLVILTIASICMLRGAWIMWTSLPA